MIEIERKFLVTSNGYKKEAKNKKRIVQGFLNTDPFRTVRIRIKEDQGFLTIKGIGNENGTTRFEWEREIPVKEAESLLELAEPGAIDKMRYEVQVGDHLFEVDEFFGENEGLMVAEVELTHEDESYEVPTWLGDEVTGQTKYYNAQLSKNPYKKWQQ
ncbi:CYTH domain-containing protein [Flavobacteriaceae bacterium KMM 6897]|nr:CYTH domain-containing protein [Flavobacteriaceae bacterium KMM 6897]MEB8346105.1 CYTH domain-containing protein [Flavobacteriaceae bacterium KMM 6898]